VPLNDKDFVIDLAKMFDAEVILECRNYLGCINHTLLSIDFLFRNSFKIKGLVLNGNFDPLVKSSIVSYAGIPVLAEFPELENFNREAALRLSKTIDLQKFDLP
jgi:dethiobiotin synthetase